MRIFAWMILFSVATASGRAEMLLEGDKKPPSKSQYQLSRLEQDIFEEINRLRANPSGYISHLETYKSYYKDKKIQLPGKPYPLQTDETGAAVDEAISWLKNQRPVGALVLSRGMTAGARDLCLDQKEHGTFGHITSDVADASQRMNRYGTWKEYMGENILYGYNRPWHVVAGFLVDDGMPRREQRNNLLDDRYRVAGVACSAHYRFGTVCVVNFSWNYLELVKRKQP